MKSGVILGCAIFLFFGFLTWFSLVALVHTGLATKTMDYGELAQRACGKKGEICVDFWTVLEGFGGCLGLVHRRWSSCVASRREKVGPGS